MAVGALGGIVPVCPGGKGTLLPDRIHDVIVAGAGPAGSRTARELARRGFDVVVLEEHAQIGTPCHCSGLVSPRTLELADVGDDIVINAIRGAVVHLPNTKPVRVAGDRLHAYVVDRIELDRRLSAQAEAAGATVIRGTRVADFRLTGDPRRATEGEVEAGVTREGVRSRVRARLLVGADGARSRVARQIREEDANGLVVGMGAVAHYDRNPLVDHVEVFLDPHSAPGWFGWTIPLGGNLARMGTGSANGITPRQSFARLGEQFPDSFGAARVRSHSGGLIALWAPTPITSDRVMLVGDAARQVKPTSGGGIHAALHAAGLAAEVADEALRRGDLSGQALSSYPRRWHGSVGRELRRQHDMRRAFERLSTKDLVDLIDLIDDPRVRGAIDHAADIDYPSRLVAAVSVRKPRLALKVIRWPRYPLAWLSDA